MALDYAEVRIRAEYPCCQRPAYLKAIESIPKEVYERLCRFCDIGWTVTRETLVENETGAVKRIDRVTWEK